MVRKKVLTYRWHAGHQYELWKLPLDFTLLYGKTNMTAHWDYKSRPLHSNVKFKEISENEDLSRYDFAILHFDEFALRANEYPHVLPSDWGDQFKFIMENYEGPKVAICHGVPIYKGAYNINYNEPDLGEIIEDYRKELVKYLDETLVICNSYQAQKEWGFKNSKVIWHGFDPLLYPQTDYKGGIITVCGGMYQRHHYRGLSLYKGVMDNISWKADFLGGKADKFPNKVKKDSLNMRLFDNKNEWATFNYDTYVNFLSNYSVFFNPTLRSPMPRTRGEAMMCGLVVVTPDNHDASMFIENGYNGFIADDPEEISMILDELDNNFKLRSKIGSRGRETAIDIFHLNNYLNEWKEVINEITGANLNLNRINTNSEYITNSKIKKAKDKVKGIIFMSGVEGGADTYRIGNAFESLENESDINLSHVVLHETKEEDIKKKLIADAFNVIICHRVGFGKKLETLVNESKSKDMLLIYDIDDLLFEEDYAKQLEEIGRKSLETGLKEVKHYKKGIELFDYATCTTNTLKMSLQKLDVKNVELLENTFTDNLLTMSNAAYKSKQFSKEQRKEIVIGYASGSATHVNDFQIIVPALTKILSEFSNVNLHLLGHIDIPKELEHFSDRITIKPFVHWLALPNILADLDINLAPLQDNKFCHAKSAIKYIEAALVHVPTVASATEPFKKAIINDITGFTANNENEWYNHLKLLVENKKKRLEIGENAFSDVKNKYSSRVKRDKIFEIIENWL